MRTRVLSIGAIGAVILVAVVVWLARQRWAQEHEASQAATQAESLTRTRVAMKWSFAGTMAPYFAARTNEIHEKHRLEVQLLESGPGKPNSIQQVLVGDADFGITGAHELAMARSRDQPIVAIAVVFKQSPTCLVSLKKTGISRPEDLKGKTVEMTAGDNSQFEFKAMLRKAGIEESEVRTLIWNWRYEKLLAGDSHATVAYENDQAVTLARAHEVSVLAPRDYGVTPYADVLFTTESLVKESPNWVGRVVFATLESWEWASAHPQEVVSAFTTSDEIRPLALDDATQLAILQKSIEFVRSGAPSVDVGAHIPTIGVQELARWEETIQLIRDYGAADKLPRAEDCYTNRWAEQYGMLAKK